MPGVIKPGPSDAAKQAGNHGKITRKFVILKRVFLTVSEKTNMEREIFPQRADRVKSIVSMEGEE